MSIRKPTQDELKRFARANYFAISDEEMPFFEEMIGQALMNLEKLEVMAERIRPMPISRDKGHYPSRQENPYGAWAWKCSIKERDGGPLAGRRIAIKDNVSVAGVPLVNGSPILQNFVPDEDATIVRRILEAGGEIAGKARCENLCTSGGSHTSFPEPVRNPRNPEYMTGGSSSGSAALLVTNEVDMAIGCDQAGSVRIPGSWSGVYALKPTFGLVPYSGIMSLETSIDSAGPMANSVYDVALLLEVIAGKDGQDTRQFNTPTLLPKYSESLGINMKNLKIGVVKEGFGWKDLSEQDVDNVVGEAARKFEQLGSYVQEVSIPDHRAGVQIWSAISFEGAWSTFVRDNGLEHAGGGYYNLHLIESWAKTRKANSDEFPFRVKLEALLGSFLGEIYNGKYYAIGQNLRKLLRSTYDVMLKEFDLLLMPTTPQKAQKFPKNQRDKIVAAPSNIVNTSPFNATGHPAINIPCGMSDGLPIGMMLIAKHFDEPTILGAAHAYEKSFDFNKL